MDLNFIVFFLNNSIAHRRPSAMRINTQVPEHPGASVPMCLITQVPEYLSA